MDIRDFHAWLDDTPGGRAYACTHGGRHAALAMHKSEAANELNRLRDATRDHDMSYPEPEPGYLAGDDSGRALALYQSAMDRRRKAHTEQLRYGPGVRKESGANLAGSTAEIAAQLRRENPMWNVETGSEPRDRSVRQGTPDRGSPGGIAWADVGG